MEEFSPNRQSNFSKPPLPRARPPIRNVNMIEESSYNLKNSENLLMKKTMYTNKDQSQEFHTLDSDTQYTDDEDDDDENSNVNIACNSSSKSPMPESFNTAHNVSFETQMRRRCSYTPNKSRSFNDTGNFSSSFKVQNQPAKASVAKFNTFLCIGICIAFLIVGLSIQAMFHKDQKAISNAEKINLTAVNDMLDKSIEKIQAKFHNQRAHVWNDIAAAIYDVTLFPTKPSIIILFGNGIVTLNCLAQLLGRLSGKILGSNDYLMLTPKDFPNDVGQTIEMLKLQILEKKAVVVSDLLSINAEAIRAFHNFCDRENPLVGHSIYIITIIADDYKSPQRELEFIEKKLLKTFSNFIDKDILDPLVTRITDGIVASIIPEPSMNFSHSNCPLSYE